MAAWAGGAVVLFGLLVVALWPSAPPPVAEDAPVPISTAITPTMMAAADAGDPEAQYVVANAMLADGELNLAYSTKALAFLQQAAERGHARAMLRLGVLYRQGIEAPQNYALAAKWIEKSAELGDARAMLEFGRMHREGVGMPMDLVKAYFWLNRAAAARDLDAPRERADVARHLTPAELKRAQDESTVSHFQPNATAGQEVAVPAVPLAATPSVR